MATRSPYLTDIVFERNPLCSLGLIIKGCCLSLYSLGNHALQVVISLRRYSTTRAIPSLAASLPDHPTIAFLMLQNEREHRMCPILRRILRYGGEARECTC